jgi:hypothetical protein
MRKVDPADVRGAFVNESTELMTYMSRARHALEGDAHEKQDISRLASTTFLSMFVAFERFLSDLFLAYLNRDFSGYQADLQGRIEQSIRERFGDWASARNRLDPVKHVAVAQLEEIVDPSGFNLTFRDAAALKAKARQWLAPQYANRIVGLSAHDDRLIDTARALRDFIAHQSPGAKDVMNARLATITQGNYNRYLGRGVHEVHSVGAYLKAVFDGSRRIGLYADRLRVIAQAL